MTAEEIERRIQRCRANLEQLNEMLKMPRSDDLCPMVDMLVSEAREEKNYMQQGGEACIAQERFDLLDQISAVSSLFEDIHRRAEAWKAGRGGGGGGAPHHPSGGFGFDAGSMDEDERIARELAAQFEEEERAARAQATPATSTRSRRSSREDDERLARELAAGMGGGSQHAAPAHDAWGGGGFDSASTGPSHADAGVTWGPGSGSESGGGRRKKDKKKKGEDAGHAAGGDAFGDAFGTGSGGAAWDADAFPAAGAAPGSGAGGFAAAGGWPTAVSDPAGAPGGFAADFGHFGADAHTSGASAPDAFGGSGADPGFPKADVGGFGADFASGGGAGGLGSPGWGAKAAAAPGGWGGGGAAFDAPAPGGSHGAFGPPLEAGGGGWGSGGGHAAPIPDLGHFHSSHSRASSVASMPGAQQATMHIRCPYEDIAQDVEGFKQNFARHLARAAGIPPHRIRVQSVRPG